MCETHVHIDARSHVRDSLLFEFIRVLLLAQWPHLIGQLNSHEMGLIRALALE